MQSEPAVVEVAVMPHADTVSNDRLRTRGPATIKQPKGSGMCAVCVAAMATNTTPDEVYEWLADGRVTGDPIHDPEVAMYLLRHGWLMGSAWQIAAEDSDGEQVDDFVDARFIVEGLIGTRAYLSVKSRNYPDLNHAVYWDGYHVRDPDPGMPEETEISEYRLVQVWPLTWVGWLDLTARLTCKPEPEPPFFVKRWRKRCAVPGEV